MNKFQVRYLLYDVFTRKPLLGNQLAVFVDGTGLDAALMQRIAREMNLSETTFVLPAEAPGTDLRMRIFTPARELPIAGHPTIGSTFALAHEGRISSGASRCVFGLEIGPTPVDLDWDGEALRFAWMTQPSPTFAPPRADRAAVAEALGLLEDDLSPDLPVQEVSCGVPFLVVPLCDRAAVDRAVSDAGAFRRFASAAGSTLPMYVFAARSRGPSSGRIASTEAGDARSRGSSRGRSASMEAGDGRSRGPSGPRIAPADDDRDKADVRPFIAYARMFAPAFGIVEDPATGSAAGPLGSYLVEHGAVTVEEASRIVIEQGVAMGRASRIHVAIEGEPGAIRSVKVGGEAVLVGRGELLLS